MGSVTERKRIAGATASIHALMNIVRIAVNYPIKNSGLLYYSEVPLLRGQAVEVPLGKRKSLGCVVATDESKSEEYKNTPEHKIKHVLNSLEGTLLTEKELCLYEWMAGYYHYSLGQLIFDCLPENLKRPREILEVKGLGEKFEFNPNPMQVVAIKAIKDNSDHFKRFLVHGVTGSGKTLVYLELIRNTLRQNKSVLFLLPEINLTPQFTETFSKYLDCTIFSYHSEITDSQKFNIFKLARNANTPILILGVRSSVFVPLKNLGLIIIDEEHDGSFKQDDRCPYNARDVATKKAQLLDIPIVMGSATPSLETFISFHSPNNKDEVFELRERAGEAFLPYVELVDTREKQQDQEGVWPLAPKSIEAIKDALSRGEQILVFVNRLGFASFIQCRACGHQFQCPNCSITLRYYKRKHLLACHHCDYKEPFPNQCPACSCLTLSQKGFGTEKVQGVLEGLFPSKKISRFDRDEIKNFSQLEDRLKEFHRGDIDIMVGTQMLSKGHNFEKVKLVLILGIDSQLNFPDFRSTEKVYQVLTQVSGRAGRYSKDGKVLIQTLNPESGLFKLVTEHSFDGFYKEESNLRKLCDCPPYKRLVLIHFSSKFQEKLIDFTTSYVGPLLQNLVAGHFSDVSVLGPRPAAIEKKSNQFTWSVMLKSADLNQLHNLLKTFEINYKSMSSITYKIDVDPYTMM